MSQYFCIGALALFCVGTIMCTIIYSLYLLCRGRCNKETAGVCLTIVMLAVIFLIILMRKH